MSFDVMGVFEVTWMAPRERSVDHMWQMALSLDVFCLRGDAVSDHLFGLCREPTGRARFAGRGAPADGSPWTKMEVAQHLAASRGRSEGSFGHTHATLGEVEAALRASDAPPVSGSSWEGVFETVAALRRVAPGLPLDCWRFVVWASW